VKCIFSKKFEGKIRYAVVSMETTGKFFVSILVDDGKEIPAKPKLDKSKAVGIDLGLKDFAVLSTGEKIAHPKTLKKHERKLKHLQRSVSRKTKGSNRRKKAVLKLAREHEKVRNIRNDFLHKLSTRLVRENQAVCLENLNVQGMLGNHRLAKSISDSGWNIFTGFLKYKTNWQGKHYIEIGRFEPSSKMCHVCGYIKDDLTLADREWDCPKCKTHHDRDGNASKNILNFALQKQNLITPTDCREVLMEGCR
jgi:putative transposase